MAASNFPIFPKLGQTSWSTLATANTLLDGTGTVATIFTSDGTNGSRLDTIKVRHLGTNIATVLRFFINNGSTNATAANNSLYMEVTVAANTLSQVAASIEYELPMDLVLPLSYKINATVGTTIAAGIAITGVGGTY